MKPAVRIDLTIQDPIPNRFLGVKLSEAYADLIIREDADVYCPDGSLLLKFRKNCLPPQACKAAWKVLRTIKGKSLNRGLATSKLFTKVPAVRKAGYVSNTHEVPAKYAVHSNIVGYFDRYIRIPFCRQASWNAKHPELFRECFPFFQAISKTYEQEAGDRFELQRAVAGRTKPEWIIPGTVFSTVTVNRNWQTAVHKDEGDLKAGLSMIVALEGGGYQGGNLIFPEFRVGVDLRNTDLLMFDSHHMHGNTPIVGKHGEWERISCVLYYREQMAKCLGAAEELERAKNRKKGDPLWE